MKFDEARFKKSLSELGLSHGLPRSRVVKLFQGKTDIVTLGKDILEILNGQIEHATLIQDSPKLSCQELEAVMNVSERLKTAGFTELEIHFEIKNEKIVCLDGRPAMAIPKVGAPGGSMTGLPASPGKVTAICSVMPITGQITGKIIVMKNSKELPILMNEKPAGIILEEGNLLSHASILAREAGIPAIVKVHDATKNLKNGEKITLDATLGVISIETT